MTLVAHLKRFILEHASGLSLTLGYSGGLDSTVLLHLLTELKKQEADLSIRAIHVHHGLSKNADAWVEHCRQTCDSLQVDFDVTYAALKPAKQKSLEQLAREARYALLDKLSDNKAALMTAQHQDDQAETLILQLMRGAGPKGLSAMSASGQLVSGRLILRPLLSVTRIELEEYARKHQLTWIEDESNSDNRFDRNFLRNQIMPMLKTRWPNANRTISRSAALCDEQQRLVESVAEQKLAKAKCSNDNDRLDLDVLRELDPSWFKQALRLWFREWQVELPSVSVMDQIYHQSFHSKGDAQVKVQLNGFELRRYDQKLYLLTPEHLQTLNEKAEVIVWPVDEKARLDYQGKSYLLEKSESGFSRAKEDIITLKFGCLTETFKYQPNRPSKSAKQWFKEWKIPPWERQTIPFFYCNSRLVQIGDKVNLLHKMAQEAGIYSIRSSHRKS